MDFSLQSVGLRMSFPFTLPDLIRFKEEVTEANFKQVFGDETGAAFFETFEDADRDPLTFFDTIEADSHAVQLFEMLIGCHASLD